ncbi:hypothetical protein MIMGU_mgv1a007616mg [Erythranthe guttata]|uniref:INO80 complex subunit B-like conserved region domain-containing protein n=1 Tax=Erythranthe guttata TaxID=4155 RepID=A0A022R3V5_ERYGU|nr:hypothetical protein MIMGU_mgv1a007616mg [Erythranthe guttata]
MDNYGVHTASKPSRRRRSNLNRRPPTPHESDSPKQENRDSISLSSTPSDHVSDAPTEGNIVQEATIWSKGLNSNQFISTASCTNLSEAETMHESNDDKESSQVNAAGTSWKSLKTDRNKTSEIVIGSHHSGKPGSVSDGPGTKNSDEYASVIGDYDSSRSGKESKKSKSVRAFEDTEYMEEEGSASEGEIKHENKKQTKEVTDFSEYSKGSSITTRRRANLTGRDISPGLVANSVQFPDGLPPAPPRKPKEQLTEEEQQLKRVEAAQRRKIQNEKAARESEAEAIRKILGQDSSRKKREEKIKKRQEELAQERSANAATVASNVVRWVMGPSGTIVTFPHDIGLPSIFESNPCSYPPPREKCVGPACTNAYKYRDSKSKMPLCSLRCYKAVHDKVQPLHAC